MLFFLEFFGFFCFFFKFFWRDSYLKKDPKLVAWRSGCGDLKIMHFLRRCEDTIYQPQPANSIFFTLRNSISSNTLRDWTRAVVVPERSLFSFSSEVDSPFLSSPLWRKILASSSQRLKLEGGRNAFAGERKEPFWRCQQNCRFLSMVL